MAPTVIKEEAPGNTLSCFANLSPLNVTDTGATQKDSYSKGYLLMFIQPLLCFDCNATVNYCSWLARVLLQHQFLEYLAKSWRAVGECESSLNNKNTNTKHILLWVKKYKPKERAFLH